VTADCVTFWIGDSLGAIERACMKSMLRQGHSVALYCYGTPAGLPSGVKTFDASSILPRTSIPSSWSNRSDLYSDWFRYEIQKLALGTWLDLDVYLVAPLDLERPYLFGEYEPRKLNGAVLRLPPDSQILAALLKQFEQRTVPKSVPILSKLHLNARRLLGGKVDLTKTRWGTTGPFALTTFAPLYGLSAEALPSDVFYPARWQDARWIADPSIRLEDKVTSRTVGIHLWNEIIKGLKDEPAPEGSFLRRLQMEGQE
jgi:hypothetical protein